jgi:uncharacterized protein YidB (DUF937 family)
MGLLDILTGMQNGPHGGQSQPAQKSGGMSPLMMALLGLLAYKAFKGSSSQPAPSMPTSGGGGLGDILGGLLGGGRPSGMPSGTPSGGLGGSVLSGGLGNLLRGFQESGHGHTADSWVGTGPNKAIAPNDLADALGSDTLDTLSQQTGMGRNDLLEALQHQLPGFVDQLTPHGRIPSEDEASRMV